MQSAALLGIYGLTCVPSSSSRSRPCCGKKRAAWTPGRRMRVVALAIALLPLALAAILGHVRLTRGDAGHVDGVKIRIVQPSVPQREKWQPENQERIFLDHLALSASNPSGKTDEMAGITHVIWPRRPCLPAAGTSRRARRHRTLLPAGTFLITGALRAEPAPPGSDRPRRIYNSLLVFGEGGALAGVYDKTHLVPFGEYLPLQRLLEAIGLRQLTRMRGGFDVGETPRPLLRVPGLPTAVPLICYEVIFPRAIVQGGERPALMLNVTNDGWFGNTTGPRQHLHQTRVRAVEEGLPVVRAANNGISAVIDAYGRTTAKLELDVRGVIDTALPGHRKRRPMPVW